MPKLLKLRTLAVLFALSSTGLWGKEVTLDYTPAAVANPLKGLVPYMGDRRELFPHSMEFFYLPLSDLVTGEDRYQWQPLEKRLNEISARGHQAVFRIYTEYPEKSDGVPVHLRDTALNDKGLPDYGNEALQRCMLNFITAFGAKYDGDPRIGFLTAGLLGKWGEWHTWPEAERWAGKPLQKRVIEQFASAVETTPVLLRYPIGGDDKTYAPNAEQPFGYHDDSFAWSTLDSDSEDDFWFYMTLLKRAGERAAQKWQTHPIGGEIRPEAWGQCFDAKPANPKVQDFDACVSATHVSWLMDSGIFSDEHRNPQRITRAKRAVQKMGYEFHVPKAQWTLKNGHVELALRIENRGVAPFYAAWPISAAVVDADGMIVASAESTDTLQNILPGDSKAFSLRVPSKERIAGIHRLLITVKNPLKDGLPLRFANTSQDAHLPGWLTLGEVE